MMEIYQIARPCLPWDIGSMASREGKKVAAEQRARALYARLMKLKPDDLSERQWAIKAGVSSSFFTNLRDKGSEPSIGNLRDVLKAIGMTIPEFFAAEAEGRLVKALSEQELVAAFASVLPGLPKEEGRHAEYLAATLSDVLELPPSMRSSMTIGDPPDSGDRGAIVPSRLPTKRAGSARSRS
jgi:hypothetical protein